MSPVPIPIQIPRMSYEVPYHPNPSYPPSQPFSQPIYPPQAGTFPIHEMYTSNPSNVVLANGGQYYPTQQTEYANINHHATQNVDVVKRPNWDIMVRPITSKCRSFLSCVYYLVDEKSELPTTETQPYLYKDPCRTSSEETGGDIAVGEGSGKKCRYRNI